MVLFEREEVARNLPIRNSKTGDGRGETREWLEWCNDEDVVRVVRYSNEPEVGLSDFVGGSDISGCDRSRLQMSAKCSGTRDKAHQR